MPSLVHHQAQKTTKMLLIGDSGGGKTGSLASLASAGYNLRILDLDNGVDVLYSLLTAKNTPYKVQDLENQVQVKTLTDRLKRGTVKTADGKVSANGTLIPSTATVWTRTLESLIDWKDKDPVSGKEYSLGALADWTSQDILIIDSLTALSTAAMNFILSINGRLGQPPYQADWGDAQRLVENLLMLLSDDNVKCNVIMIAHIAFIGEENGPVRGYPNTLGQKLPPKVARYFNSILMCKSTGQGTAERRKILTNTSGIIDLKNTSPLAVPPSYPLQSGLAEYFACVRGEEPSALIKSIAARV